MRYSIVIKQLFIIAKSKWALSFFQGNVFSLASFEVISNLKKMVPNLNYILDVGANSGQFSKAAIAFYPEAKIDAFEPLPNLFPKTAKKFKNSKNINIHNLALGNENGKIKFNQNEYEHISSILEINSENIHYPKQLITSPQIEVEIKTLDSFLADKELPPLTLLKLDVQGYEMEVLKGATKAVEKIDYIILEANLEQLYINQPSFTEMNNYLTGIGFELQGMLDFNLGFKNKYIEIDLLFKKKK